MLKLGNLKLALPFIQAPLSGYSDYAMRKLAAEHGAPLTFAGVMLAKSAAHPKIIIKPSFRPHEDEHPVGAQILGDEADICVKAAIALAGAGFDILDLNFACPAPKVLRRSRGGAMLDYPEKIIDTYKQVRDAISMPLTVKLRIGVTDSEESREKYWQAVEGICEHGVDAMMVHGRSVSQKYRGHADWQILAETKRRFSGTTILGSGDIFHAQTAVEMMTEAKIDGLVVARGAIGNPWIFRDLKAIFENRTPPETPPLDEQKEIVMRHYNLVNELYGKGKPVAYMRKFMANYCKLHPERKKAQKSFMAASTHEQFIAAIAQWYN